jgi:hypothetical protein
LDFNFCVPALLLLLTPERLPGRALMQSFVQSSMDCLEADESELWLELLMEDCEIDSERAKFLHKETNELIGIFTTIVSKVRRNLD